MPILEKGSGFLMRELSSHCHTYMSSLFGPYDNDAHILRSFTMKKGRKNSTEVLLDLIDALLYFE